MGSVFELQLVHRGIPSEALKRGILTMSIRKSDASPTSSVQAEPKGNETSVAALSAEQFPEVNEVLFYRHAPHMESLVFAPPDLAARESQIYRAFAAKTWGEFQYFMPEDDFRELIKAKCKITWDELFVIPQPDDPFEPETICPSYSVGNYPDWLQKTQDLWLPKEILEHWGRRESSMFNGPFWIIDPKKEQKIVLRLRKLRIHAQRRDDLYFY
jgi:hypothetical protein